MSDNNNIKSSQDDRKRDGAHAPQQARSAWSIFSVPRPLKQFFDQFPLRTYHVNELPRRSPRHRDEHTLYVFTTDRDAARGRPSFNPQCLKYQAYLKFAGLDFRTVVSSNHASPTGVLPFLLPASHDVDHLSPSKPIPSNKLKKWLTSQQSVKAPEESEDSRYETYASLLDSRVRIAWLCQLYLAAPNSQLLRRLYVDACSSQPFVRLAIEHQLRAAAEAEVVKASYSNVISIHDIMRDAREAFQALADLLGEDEWFYGQPSPSMFDASVFAYTQLILDGSLDWSFTPLKEQVSEFPGLVRHRERILELYF